MSELPKWLQDIKARDIEASGVFDRWQPETEGNAQFKAALKDRALLLSVVEPLLVEHEVAMYKGYDKWLGIRLEVTKALEAAQKTSEIK